MINTPHKEKLARSLELAFGCPYNDRRKEIVASMPREMSYNQDGAVKTIKRELLLTEAIEPGLLQTDVANTVTEGAAQARCWFDILPVYNIKGNAYVHSYGEAGMYADVVAEGAEFPNRSQDYNIATFATLKYGQSPKISNEDIEDARVDVIAQEILFAGKAVQNAAERKVNNAILEGSGDAFDTAGTNQGVKAIIRAATKLRGNGFNAGAVVMHPDLEGIVLLDINAPNASLIGNGSVPEGYLGMKWERCGVADVAGGTYTWGYSTNDYIGGLVIDPARCGGIAVSRPLTVDEFDGAAHDVKGMNISIRMDAKPFVSTAACRVQY